MPVYEYAPVESEQHAPTCTHTGRFEVSQRMSDPTLTTCPACGVAVRKLISNTSFALKGSGWYASDYKSGGTSPAKSEPAATPATEKKEASGGGCGAAACGTGCAGAASA